jgi:hypothetical protein
MVVAAIADAFGEKVAREKPWWVQLLASLGCLLMFALAAALPCLLVWLLWTMIDP